MSNFISPLLIIAYVLRTTTLFLPINNKKGLNMSDIDIGPYAFSGYESAIVPTPPGQNVPPIAYAPPKSINSTADLSKIRLENSGLSSRPPTKTQIEDVSQEQNPLGNWKVRIKLGDKSIFNMDKILAPLNSFGGIIFPYTPQIQVLHQAIYIPQRLTHSNYAHFAYEASEVQAINITADFTVQTSQEGKYVLACIYFLRACTKMFFGQGELAGNPPPLVFLEGYGNSYFPNVPCIVTSFQHTMPNEVDYMEIEGERMPTVSQITVSLQPVYSKNSVTQFDLKEFADGNLISKKFI